MAQRSPQSCQPGWAWPQAAATEVLRHTQPVSHEAPSSSRSCFRRATGKPLRPAPQKLCSSGGSEAAPQRKAVWAANMVPSRIRPPWGTSAVVTVMGEADSDPQTERLPQSAKSACLLVSTDCRRDSEQSRDHRSHLRQGSLSVCLVEGSGPS